MSTRIKWTKTDVILAFQEVILGLNKPVTAPPEELLAKALGGSEGVPETGLPVPTATPPISPPM